MTNLWWTVPTVTDRNGLHLEQADGAWHVTGTATAPDTTLGAWITLETGQHTLTADASDSRLYATLGLTAGENLLDSTGMRTAHLDAGRYLAYIRCNVGKGETIDATITPTLTLVTQ